MKAALTKYVDGPVVSHVNLEDVYEAILKDERLGAVVGVTIALGGDSDQQLSGRDKSSSLI